MKFVRLISLFRSIFLFLAVLLIDPAQIRAQATSNEGTNFWAVFPSHVPSAAPDGSNARLANYSIFITGKEASSGIVSVGTWQFRFNLTQGNSVLEVQVPRAQAYIESWQSGQVLRNRAIRVEVDPGKPKIVVYGHIFAGKRSAASLILPKEALGQQYYSMNFTGALTSDGGQSFITVVATEPNTRIFFESGGQQLVSGGVLLSNVGDVYQYLGNGDLTGTRVYVDPSSAECKQFAMFSGTTNSSIISNAGCTGVFSSDPLYQQSYPIGSWGKTYGYVPFSQGGANGSQSRTFGNYIRILAQEDDTKVSYNGITVTLRAGQYHTSASPLSSPTLISADKPVAVAQYALSQYCQGGGLGDPDMVILNPIEYSIKNITVYSSSKEEITESFVNVFIRTSAVESFRINGERPRDNFQPLSSASGYSYLQLNLDQYPGQTFNLSASGGFNAIAYGFGDAESYAYSAGTNLATNLNVQTLSAATLEEINGACINLPIRFKLTLTSPAKEITWITDPNEVPIRETAPNPTSVVRNNTTYYEYLYPGQQTYETSGDKVITVIAEYPVVSGCSNLQQELEVVFSVYDPPEARFSFTGKDCVNSMIEFRDESNDGGDPITVWNWDFGDGSSSDKQHPVHRYQAPGVYTVRLVIGNSTNCTGVIYEQQVTVQPAPEAAFAMSQPGCENAPLEFTDQSTIQAGRIVRWEWDMGDGNTYDRVDPGVFTHSYASNGTYEITLVVTSEFGCSDTLSRTFELITPSLEAGPDMYIIRGGRATFNISASGTGLSFRWLPAADLDDPGLMNPTVSPTEDTRYEVVMETAGGCELWDELYVRVVESPVIPNTFTPNGDGMNDTWNILYLDTYPGVTVNIFNRFGVKVFESSGYPDPWDGRFRGEVLPAGTYYYVIKTDEGLPDYSGWVALLR